MTYGTVLFGFQAETFHKSVQATANSITGALFLQGAGGIFAVPLIQRFGRLPVLFYSQLLCALMVMAVGGHKG
jgi:MFS family permease